MGRITAEDRKRYADKVSEYKTVITQGQAREKTLCDLLSQDSVGSSYKRITLAEEALGIYSYQLLLSNLSVTMLGIKSEDWLAEARKTLYRAMKYLEDTVTPYIDVPFSDYEPKLEELSELSQEKRYLLIRKFGFAIQQLEDAFGETSKWKWSFVEIWAKFATIAKNFLNLKTIVKNMDIDSDCREATVDHLNLVKRLFQQSADRYREKYELVSARVEDFNLAITYLSALKRLNALLGERDDVETLKKKIDIWNNKKESDAKKRDETAKAHAAAAAAAARESADE
jgi:hypothetical protein